MLEELKAELIVCQKRLVSNNILPPKMSQLDSPAWIVFHMQRGQSSAALKVVKFHSSGRLYRSEWQHLCSHTCERSGKCLFKALFCLEIVSSPCHTLHIANRSSARDRGLPIVTGQNSIA